MDSVPRGRKLCIREGCEASNVGRGLCNKHYYRAMKGKDPLPPRIQMKYTGECIVDGCVKPDKNRGLCCMHSRRKRVHGDVHMRLRPEGGNGYTKEGYRMVSRKGHPNATAAGQVFEHRWLMAQYLGRPLRADENIHHKNGVLDDNRLENLELWTKMQPSGKRPVDLVAYAHEILNRYEGELKLF